MGDDPPGFLADLQVAIFGLGLMGGSLAMALRGRCAGLLGVDPHPETLVLARRIDLVDQLLSEPDERLAQADVLVLAAPVRAILRLVAALPGIHPGAPLVLDLGSTKHAILAAMEALPGRFDPLGGHPMCGKEHSSLSNAEASLYRGANFALTPLARTSTRAKAIAVQMVEAVGAQVVWLEPDTHDRWTAATSHLPYLVANTLAGITPVEAQPMVAGGFRSTARVAASSPEVMLDILATNRENVLAGIAAFRERMAALESCLAAEDDEGLRRLLASGARRYDQLTGS
jgi:prephenate dehydrogenase